MTYNALIAMAARMIKEKGAACVWLSASLAVDVDAPWNEETTTATEHETVIVLLPFDTFSRRMLGYSDGQAVPEGSLVGLVPGSTEFTPSLRDEVLVGSKRYAIGAADVLNPNADKDIIYILELRQ